MHISVIGTGAMGSAVAQALLDAGVDVTVYNRTRTKTERLAQLGAKVADDPKAAIAATDGAILALTDGPAIHELGRSYLSDGSLAGKPALSVSVLTPDEFDRLASEFAGYGLRLSEVAIGAYPDHVIRRQAEFLLATHPQDNDLWLTALRKLGTCFELGEPGNASKAYMALCAPYMLMPIAAAFAVGMFERLGLSPTIVARMLQSNPTIASPGASVLAAEMVGRRYGQGQFSVDNFIVMADQVIEFARKLDMPTAVFDEVRAAFCRVSAAGLGRYDVPAIYEYFASAVSTQLPIRTGK